MRELRLLPPALTCWLSLLGLFLSGDPAVGFLVAGVVVAALCAAGERGQVLLTGALTCLTVSAADIRVTVAEKFRFSPGFTATVEGAPSLTSSGTVLVDLRVPGYPATLPVFTEDLSSLDIPAGSTVVVDATVTPSGRPGVGVLIGSGDVDPVGQPEGMAAVAHHVRHTLRTAVTEHVTGEHRGLIPGMTLGDTSLQSATSDALYTSTGLSHLSAVSGANIAIVTVAALLICRAVTLGPRAQATAAVSSLLLYAALVGTEPSVLRAAVTGVVGLVATVASSRMQPIHALSAAILTLLIFDPGLAVDYGFALSVGATAGIVALMPVVARPLISAGLPPVFARAIGVAVAADVVTMPIIALMTGKVSVVSVLANLLVAPAAAPVTVLGLLSTVLSLIPGPWEIPILWLITPLTWWIHAVAHMCSVLPVVTVAAGPLGVMLIYGWVIAGLVCRRVLLTVGVLALGAVWLAGPSTSEPEVDPAFLRAVTVESEDEIEDVAPGTQLIVVLDPAGAPADRPTVTVDGVAVLYPNRDGEVTLHTDGTQHAADGRF